MTTFINISERYGEQVEVTMADYLELNPTGTFVQNDKSIREEMPNGDYEIVAEWQDTAVETI